MAEYTRIQNNFASGYVDPTLHGLIASDTYGSGLKRCLNFLPSSLGYLYRRPGTRFLGVNLDGVSTCRIHAVKSDLDLVVAVISYHKIDFYMMDDRGTVKDLFHIEHGQVFDEFRNGVNFIPWSDSALPDLDIYEFEGSLYIVHEDYPPCVVRTVNRGTSEVMVDETEPVEAASYDAPETQQEYFLSQVRGPAGLYCEKVKFKDGGLETFDKPYHYPSCQTFKGGRWYLSGLKEKPATIYASKAPDVNGDYRFDDFGVGAFYLVHLKATMTKVTTYETNELAGNIENVVYRSTDNTTDEDSRIAVNGLDVEVPEPSSTTVYKRYNSSNELISEMSEDMAFDETKFNTKTLEVITTADTWTLKSDMQLDDALELNESDMYGSRVNWLLTQQRVIAGTSRSIWMDNGSPATPADFDMVKTLATTTSHIKPVMLSSMIIFVPSDRKGVKAFYYDNDAGGYQLIDISASARSLFRESTVMEIAMVEGRENILWVLLSNGRLLSCTMGASYGWAEHEIGGGGNVLSIFPYLSDSGMSSLFMVVRRGQKTGVERMVLEDLVNTNVFTLCDCAVDIDAEGGEVDFSSVNAYSEGDELQIVAGGWPRLPFQFQKTQMDIGPGSTAGIYVGYPYRSECTMLWQELPTNASQSSLSFFRKATSMALLVYRSAGAECGWYAGGRKHLDPFQRLAKSNAVEPTYADYFTGIVKLSVPSNTSEQVNATVECNQPLPMTVQAIETRYIIQEA